MSSVWAWECTLPREANAIPAASSQRAVRRIGRGGEYVVPAQLVKPRHQFGIAGKGARRGHVLEPVAFPQSAGVAKGAYAALGAHSGAGENGEMFILHGWRR